MAEIFRKSVTLKPNSDYTAKKEYEIIKWTPKDSDRVGWCPKYSNGGIESEE